MLLLSGNTLQRFLNHSAAIHLQSQSEHVAFDIPNQGTLLFNSAKLKELLYNIVSKHVWGEGCESNIAVVFISFDLSSRPLFIFVLFLKLV